MPADKFIQEVKLLAFHSTLARSSVDWSLLYSPDFEVFALIVHCTMGAIGIHLTTVTLLLTVSSCARAYGRDLGM